MKFNFEKKIDSKLEAIDGSYVLINNPSFEGNCYCNPGDEINIVK